MIVCEGCSNQEISILELPCSHSICVRCVANQAFFLPKVHSLGLFVCCGCGLRYSTGQYFPSTIQKPSTPVPKLDLPNYPDYISGFDMAYNGSNESIDLFEEEMGPHIKVKTSNDLTIMMSPKEITQYITPRHLKLLRGGEGLDTAKNSMREVSEGGYSSRSNMPNSLRDHKFQIQIESSQNPNQECTIPLLDLKWHIPSFPDSIRRIFDDRPKLIKSKPKVLPNNSTLVLKYNHFHENSSHVSKPNLEKKEFAKVPDKNIEFSIAKAESSRKTILESYTERIPDSKKSNTRDLFDSFAFDDKKSQEKSIESLPDSKIRNQKNLTTEAVFLPDQNLTDRKRIRQYGARVHRTLNYLDLDAFQKIQSDGDVNFFRSESDNRSFGRSDRGSNTDSIKSKDIDIKALKRKIESKDALKSHHLPKKSTYLTSLNKSKILRSSEILSMKPTIDHTAHAGGSKWTNIHSTQKEKSHTNEDNMSYNSLNKNKSWFAGFYKKNSQNEGGLAQRNKELVSANRGVVEKFITSTNKTRDHQNLSYSMIKHGYADARSEVGNSSPRKRPSTDMLQSLHRRAISSIYENTPRKSSYSRDSSLIIKGNTSTLLSSPNTLMLKYPNNDYNSKSKPHSISRMIDSIGK